MNRCLCFILVKTCLLLSTGRRVVHARQLEMETVTRPNMSTLLLKTEVISFVVQQSPTEHKLYSNSSTSTGVFPTPAQPAADPRFHVGSFIGGMMLALVITLAVILGYRLTCSRREVRYRAIEEHDAII